MSTGVLAVPVTALVAGLVVWKTKLAAGSVVAGAMEQLEAAPGPALMIVAKAVAVAPISIERLSGKTAATSAAGAAGASCTSVRLHGCNVTLKLGGLAPSDDDTGPAQTPFCD
jgi:hypothetical protein